VNENDINIFGGLKMGTGWYNVMIKSNKPKNNFERMAAAGMGQLLRHMMEGPFAIVSAERGEMTPQEKDIAMRSLKKHIHDLGYGFVDTKGAWRDQGSDVFSQEGSVFIPGIDAEKAEAISRKFGQEAVIIGDDGIFELLYTEPEYKTPPANERDQRFLSEILQVPPLEDSPDMYTEVGNKKFVFETDKSLGFTPEEIEKRQKDFESLIRNPKKVQSSVFHVWGYKGNPPPMMRRSMLGQIINEPVTIPSMAYYIPFTASVYEDLPRFDPSPHWLKAMTRRAEVAAVPAVYDSDVYEEALGGLSRFHGSVNEVFDKHKLGGSNLAGFDSLYLGPSGKLFLLEPHTHDDTSGKVLRKVHPEMSFNKRLKGGGCTHTDLSSRSGIQRLQVYRDGMGVTIDMGNPPNQTQLGAIRSVFKQTPMETFIAEINFEGKTVATLKSFSELVSFVNNFDPKNPETTKVIPAYFGRTL
jgi:hypothetical protein